MSKEYNISITAENENIQIKYLKLYLNTRMNAFSYLPPLFTMQEI